MNVLESFSLAGKTALVTGCSRGIGRAMAEALAEAGADIIGVSASIRPGSAVEQAVAERGRRFNCHACDLSDRHALQALCEKLLSGKEPIDILVNNAGDIYRAPAARHPDSEWDRILEINLSSQFFLARAGGGAMLERGSGKIIFTTSLLAFQGGINVPGYAASKGGVSQLAKALANEWAGKGVNVNAIAPGYIATDNTQALRDYPARSRQILERIPAARWGRPDDLKGATVFLASAASDYVHGATLLVDGGWMGR